MLNSKSIKSPAFTREKLPRTMNEMKVHTIICLINSGVIFDKSLKNLDIGLPTEYDECEAYLNIALDDYGVEKSVRELVVQKYMMRFNPTWESSHLFFALAESQEDTVEFLLDHFPNLIGEENSYGCTPLTVAASLNEVSALRKLIGMGADLNAISPDYKVDHIDCEGSSPLIEAAENGSKDAIVLLIKAGADMEISDRSGRTALGLALDNQQWATMEILVTSGASGLLCRNRDDSVTILRCGESDCLSEIIELLRTGDNNVIVRMS